VGQLLDAGERPLLLGGDHSLTYPALRAANARYGQLDVLHFDAHPDLYPQLDGDKYSHACAFTRSLERGLIDRLVQVGIRTANRPQREVAEQYGVEQLTMANWKSGSAFFFERPVWISLDLDALDPAFAPGVSHPEPGGLSVRDVIGVLQRLGGNVIGADLVEYNPDTDIQGVTAPICFKLIKELAAVLLQ
jgi:agmatinase